MEDAPAGGLVYDESSFNEEVIEISKSDPNLMFASFECVEVGQIVEIIASAENMYTDDPLQEFGLEVWDGATVLRSVTAVGKNEPKRQTLIFQHVVASPSDVYSFVVSRKNTISNKNLSFHPGQIQVSFKVYEPERNPQLGVLPCDP